MKKHFSKVLMALISSLSLVSCSEKPEVVISSSSSSQISTNENKEKTDIITSSSNLSFTKEILNKDTEQPLPLSEQLYNGDEVLDIIINYNKIIQNFMESIEKN